MTRDLRAHEWMATKPDSTQAPLRAELPFPVDLKKLHPWVQKTWDNYRQRKWRPCVCFNLSVSRELVERSIQIIESVVRGCESRGVYLNAPVESPHRVVHPRFKIGKGEVDIYLREPCTRSYEKGQFGRTRVDTPTGYLVFTLEGLLYHYKGRKRWEERANKSLETWIAEIVESIQGAAIHLSKQVEEREDEEHFWERRKEMESFHKSVKEIQDTSLTKLLGDARSVSIVRDLRAYIAEMEKRLEQGGIDVLEDAQAWLKWASSVVTEVDPLAPGREPWQEPAFRKLVLDLVPPVPFRPAFGLQPSV